MTEKEMAKLGIESREEFVKGIDYNDELKLVKLVRDELVKNLKKKGYEVSKEDFHAGPVGKKAVPLMFLKSEGDYKENKNVYSFRLEDNSIPILEKWKDSDESLLKTLRKEDIRIGKHKSFKSFVKKTKNALEEKGLLSENDGKEI